MFITAQEVMNVVAGAAARSEGPDGTNIYESITNEDVVMAQFIIEAYVGRVEANIDSPKDKAMMARAVAFQTIYMLDNPNITLNQVKATMVSSGGQMTTFSDDYSPFIAPLAAKTCSHLSWRNSRSVRFGRLNQGKGISPLRRWATE